MVLCRNQTLGVWYRTRSEVKSLNEKQDKKYQGGRPHPFSEVEGGCCQQNVNFIPCCSFEVVAKHPEIVFYMTDYRFNCAPASEFGLGFALVARRCVFSGRIWNLDPRSSNIRFTAKTPIAKSPFRPLASYCFYLVNKRSQAVASYSLKAFCAPTIIPSLMV